MITIVNYRERFRRDIEKLDRDIANRIAGQSDVIRDSICIALSDGVFEAVGCLQADSTFLRNREGSPSFLNMMYKAVQNEDEAEASVVVIEELKYRFEKIRKQNPTADVRMRTWVHAESTALTDLMYDEGFFVGAVMNMMSRPVEETDRLTEPSSGQPYEDESELSPEKYTQWFEAQGRSEEIEYRELCYNSPEWNDYFALSERCYGAADSENELRFRLKQPKSRVLCAFAGDVPVAALTIWPVSDERYATENVFCEPGYRRRGITEKLLRYAWSILCDEGAALAVLSVYADNLPAVSLYRKCGYTTDRCLLELQYR